MSLKKLDQSCCSPEKENRRSQSPTIGKNPIGGAKINKSNWTPTIGKNQIGGAKISKSNRTPTIACTSQQQQQAKCELILKGNQPIQKLQHKGTELRRLSNICAFLHLGQMARSRWIRCQNFPTEILGAVPRNFDPSIFPQIHPQTSLKPPEFRKKRVES